MAFRAFAVLIDSEGTAARYDCGVTEDGPERGVLRIAHSPDLIFAWEDGRHDDWIAPRIAGRAGRIFRETGSWPDNASIQAG